MFDADRSSSARRPRNLSLISRKTRRPRLTSPSPGFAGASGRRAIAGKPAFRSRNGLPPPARRALPGRVGPTAAGGGEPGLPPFELATEERRVVIDADRQAVLRPPPPPRGGSSAADGSAGSGRRRAGPRAGAPTGPRPAPAAPGAWPRRRPTPRRRPGAPRSRRSARRGPASPRSRPGHTTGPVPAGDGAVALGDPGPAPIRTRPIETAGDATRILRIMAVVPGVVGDRGGKLRLIQLPRGKPSAARISPRIEGSRRPFDHRHGEKSRVGDDLAG